MISTSKNVKELENKLENIVSRATLVWQDRMKLESGQEASQEIKVDLIKKYFCFLYMNAMFLINKFRKT